MRFLKVALALPTFLAFASPALAQSEPMMQKSLVNVERGGLALQGYDPVAFFTESRPVEGNPQFTAMYRGAKYRFTSADHKMMFEQDPSKYEPAFGGYCAYGVSEGGLFPVEVSTFQILHGRLVLNKNPEVRKLFDKDREGRYQKADEKWPGLVEKRGK